MEDVSSSTLVKQLGSSVSAVCIAPGWMFCGMHNGTITAMPLRESEARPTEFAAHRGAIRALCATIPEGGSFMLFSASADGEAKCWSFPSNGEWRMTYAGHTDAVEALGLFGAALVTGGADGTLRGWNVATGTALWAVRCHSGRVTAVVVPDFPEGVEHCLPAGLILTASDDTLGKLIDANAKAVHSVFRIEAPALCAAFVPAAGAAVFGTSDGRVRGFQATTGQPLFAIAAHAEAVNAVVAVDGDLYSCSDDRRVVLWLAPTWAQGHVFAGHTQSVSCVATDGHDLVSCGFDGAVRGWDRAGVVDKIRTAQQQAAEERAARLKREREAAKMAEAPGKKGKPSKR